MECPQCECVATGFPEDDRIVCDYCGFQKNGTEFTKGYGSVWYKDRVQLLTRPMSVMDRIDLYESDEVTDFYVWDEDHLETLKGNTPESMNIRQQAEYFAYERENRSFTKYADAVPWDMLDD